LKQASVLLASMVAAMLLVCGAVLAQTQSSKAVGPPDRYIVVLKESSSDPGWAADGMARRYGLGGGPVYSHALKGFSAVIPNERVAAVRADERVEYVEPDKTYYAVSQTLPWGIKRIDAYKSSTVAGNGSGYVSNVNAYIIDSGIYRHTDLNVDGHVNFTGDGEPTDCYGHGTHVAGTVAAKDNASGVVGVAPGAQLTGVKVLGCNGRGTLTNILKGVDWVTGHAEKPAIANMSLSGSASQTLDDAVKRSAGSGVFYSIAAGNNDANACNYSPARAGAGTNNGIVTTAATTNNNEETGSSNYGSCVDLWAPGANILSTKLGGGTKRMSGTSMASPHVGGGGALYLRSHTGASPSSVEGALEAAARKPGTRSDEGRSILLENVGTF
jgi:aqualysin 1